MFDNDRPLREPVRLSALGFKRKAGMKGCGSFSGQDDPAQSEIATSVTRELFDATFSPRGDV
jgi:hypothetical protein